MLVSVLLSASTLSRSAFGILPNASLVGAKTVSAGVVFRVSPSFALVTAVTRVLSSGLPDAAVATGTFDMASKLPGLLASVGTAAQPAPNVAMSIAGAEVAAAVAAGVVAAGAVDVPAVSSALSPQAAMDSENRTAAEMAVILVARIGV